MFRPGRWHVGCNPKGWLFMRLEAGSGAAGWVAANCSVKGSLGMSRTTCLCGSRMLVGLVRGRQQTNC